MRQNHGGRNSGTNLSSSLKSYVNSTAPRSPITHCENIETLARDISEKCEDVLADGNFRIGLAQKALNLYLKFYWWLGVINIPPPHCPIDSIVLKEVPEYNDSPWTKITQINEYMNVIEKVRKKARKLPLAEWEMQVYNNAQK